MVAEKSELREYLEAFGIAIVLALFIITFIAQSFVVQGRSMEPTLHNGQRLLVDKLTYRFRPPAAGEIVVFRYPADPRRKFIKRIIGTPGDEVMIRDTVVYVNGKPLDEPYINAPTYGDWGPRKVPAGRYFVLGDNRNNSDDSRFPDVGFVDRSLLMGRAIASYWPVGTMGIIRVPESFGR
ncbi:MAG: signal peptidase I [Firmicutes bacterium]|nr:signal peptidase I [Bacillota bacterium]